MLTISKANTRSTVHRPVFPEYIGVKRFDASGAVVGERRFLGLWTSAAYSTSPGEIPILRRKVDTVLERAGFPRGSHSGKDLLAILESYPRDELFQVDVDDLYETSMGILHLQERRRVRLFVPPRCLRSVLLMPRLRAPRAADDRSRASRAGDPALCLRRVERREHHADLRVGARSAACHRLRRTDRCERRGRHRRGRAAAGRHRSIVVGRPVRGAHRAQRRGARRRAAPPLRRRVPCRIPGGRRPPERSRRHPARRCAHRAGGI